MNFILFLVDLLKTASLKLIVHINFGLNHFCKIQINDKLENRFIFIIKNKFEIKLTFKMRNCSLLSDSNYRHY